MSDIDNPPPEPPTSPGGPGDDDISPVAIEDEVKRSYLDYAMSVIVSRALPDVRDGLKPVHRRILFAMQEGGYTASRGYSKSSRIVGDVMGKYHPHGDTAIYDAMVRMAQDFAMRLPLIDGQGNFGSMDNDPPAAMRYTEARLARAAESLLDDIQKETVDFQPNYDGKEEEPVVLPARFPNLLVNGAGGIAVGMATSIPTHNLGELIDACCALIEDPDLTLEQLMEIVPGPDFPTGGVIVGRAGIVQAYSTGHGSIPIRARVGIEQIRKDREAIVVTEIPYQVNKARMIERVSRLSADKTIEGLGEMRDESDRHGLRVVFEIKRDAMADVVLNQLYRHSELQTSFACNMLALNGGRPMVMTLKEMLVAFLDFREEVITRRTIYDLRRARERAHVLIGLAVAVANIDDIVALIRNAPDPGTARRGLVERAWPAEDVAPLIRLVDEPDRPVQADGTYFMSEEQAAEILNLRLQRLTGLEREKIGDDLKAITDTIRDYLETLANRDKLIGILRDELIEVKERFATPRRTEIQASELDTDDEDLIQREDMVVTVSNGGYVKRVPLSTYRAQRRGGKGRTAMSTKDEDFVSELFVANTHDPVLIFTTRGLVYKTKVYRLPLGTPQGRGKALVNLFPLEPGESISAFMPLPQDEESWDQLNVMFATSVGTVRRNHLSDFRNIRSNGLIAMKLDEGERLIAVKTCQETDDVLLSALNGRCVRFPVTDVRLFAGRTSTGVRGIRLGSGDEVISMSILRGVEASPEERAAYLRQANALRRATGIEASSDEEALVAETDDADATAVTGSMVLDTERFAQLSAAEQFVLTVTERGFGKRTSAYEYRTMNRGGQGVWNMDLTQRNGKLVAAFPIEDGQQLLLVTDGGRLMRIAVDDIRIAGRKTQGVTLFRVDDGERVVSVASLAEDEDNGEDEDNVDESGDDGNGDTGGGAVEPAPDTPGS